MAQLPEQPPAASTEDIASSLRTSLSINAIREVIYVDRPIKVNWTVIESNTNVFFCKHRDWSNEEEVRLLHRKLGGPILALNPDAIMRVILGKDMPSEKAEQIRQRGPHERQPPPGRLDSVGRVGSETADRRLIRTA